MISVAVIGYGYWGPNLVRNISASSSCRLKLVVDTDSSRLKKAVCLYPSIETATDFTSAIKRPDIDAIVIATPLSTHFPFARAALKAGKHVLIEKPMASSVSEGRILVDMAIKKKLTLMVDHTFLYTGAVRKIKDMIHGGGIGKVCYFDSTRINLGLFQQDINVLWDLAPHDLSILNYVLDREPSSVVAAGVSHTSNKLEDIAYATYFYGSDTIAHLNCSWISPVKIRKILIGGTSRMIVYDDMEPTEKVKVYDSGFSSRKLSQKHQMLMDYRVGDIFIPKIDTTEALTGVIDDFARSIEKGREPSIGWRLALGVLKLLEAADKSMQRRGREVKIA
jgi:predicted dehydrogenase